MAEVMENLDQVKEGKESEKAMRDITSEGK